MLPVNTYVLDKLKKVEAIPVKFHEPRTGSTGNHDAFVAFILAYRIKQILQDHYGQMTRPVRAHPTLHLWERLCDCISNQIIAINQIISSCHASEITASSVLHKIEGIKCVEVMLQSRAWRQHTEAFMSLMRFFDWSKVPSGRRPAFLRNIKDMMKQVS